MKRNLYCLETLKEQTMCGNMNEQPMTKSE